MGSHSLFQTDLSLSIPKQGHAGSTKLSICLVIGGLQLDEICPQL